MLKIRNDDDYFFDDLMFSIYSCISKNMDVNIYEHFGKLMPSIIESLVKENIYNMCDENAGDEIIIYGSMSEPGLPNNFNETFREQTRYKTIFTYTDNLVSTRLCNNGNLTTSGTHKASSNKRMYDCFVEVRDRHGICKSFIQFCSFNLGTKGRCLLEITPSERR